MLNYRRLARHRKFNFYQTESFFSFKTLKNCETKKNLTIFLKTKIRSNFLKFEFILLIDYFHISYFIHEFTPNFHGKMQGTSKFLILARIYKNNKNLTFALKIQQQEFNNKNLTFVK